MLEPQLNCEKNCDKLTSLKAFNHSTDCVTDACSNQPHTVLVLLTSRLETNSTTHLKTKVNNTM